MFFRKKTRTEKFIDDAKDLASQVSSWLQERIDDAPDPDEVRQAVSESTREGVEAARDKLEQVAGWLSDFAADTAERAEDLSARTVDNVKEVLPAKRDEGGKGKAVAVAVGAGAAAVYFFHPEEGAGRRERFVDYLKSLWARVSGQNF